MRAKMPNYAKREKELLTAQQQKLADASRRPGIETLDDQALLKLIASLEQARDRASTEAEADGLSQAGLLTTAVGRAHSERRRRKLAVGEVASRNGAGGTAAKPAKPVSRAPASGRRVPAGRKTADTRKSDQRTGVRRVRKATDKSDDSAATAPQADTPQPVAAPIADEATAARKAEKKAAKQAAKTAEKEAKQAARKAEKEAARAARKSAKLAAKEAEKALRKAESKAKGKGDGGKAAKSPKAAGKKKKDKKAKSN